MFDKKTIKDISVRGKIVLVRVDYNVPLDDNGNVTSDLRIRASLPTLRYLYDQGAKKIILISHLGRPDGTRVKSLSLKPVAAALAQIVKENFPPEKQPAVHFIDDVSGPDVEAAADNMENGDILLLENLRFYPGEEKNSSDFIQEIIESVHAGVFVQDGFAVVHRAHASTEAVTHELSSVAGLLVEKEVSTLRRALESPAHPVVVIIGGVKVADKQPLVDSFAKIADHIIVVGKIAADGYVAAPEIADKVYTAEDFRENAEGQKLDIGNVSVEKIADILSSAKTIIWNGVAGMVENPEFAKSSEKIADIIGAKPDATTIICGGDTSGFIENYLPAHPELSYSLISTGGGASLELLSGLSLPGVDSLEAK